MQKQELLTLCAGLQIKHNTYDDRQTLVKRLLAKAGFISEANAVPKLRAEPLTEADMEAALIEYIKLEIGMLTSSAQMLQTLLDLYSTDKKAHYLSLARSARHELLGYSGHSNIGKIAGYLK